jgi:hypothetical protein
MHDRDDSLYAFDNLFNCLYKITPTQSLPKPGAAKNIILAFVSPTLKI